MTATATDVREWAKREGLDVPERGSPGKAVRDLYDAAHPPEPPGESSGEDLGDDYDGVTAADFPPDTGEQPPRPPERPGGRRLISNLFRRDKGKPARARGNRRRIPLNDFAEGVWTDLADVAPWPPLRECFRFQAAYAATVFDDAVKGTVLDPILQSIARADTALRAIDGLFGVPVFTAMICAAGNADQDATGNLIYDEQGWPVWDSRTELMFAGLKYSVRQMLRFADADLEKIEAKSAEMDERGRKADLMIAAMFASLRRPPAEQPAPGPAAEPPLPETQVRQMGNGHTAADPGPVPFRPAQAQAQHRTQGGKRYPKPPPMTAEGADPKRS